MTEVKSPLKLHRSAGRFFEAGGVRSFVREEGPEDGEIVICVHGILSSSFLYRNVLPELASSGYRAVSIDLPGLGLSDRPEDFDYSWTGLGSWLCKATETLELTKFHFVVHDIGGPIGFELLAAHPERILSLTILNTMLEVSTFKKPLPMLLFGSSLIGPIAMAATSAMSLKILLEWKGVQNDMDYADVQAWVYLLKYQDNGKAFLKIMQSFETTKEKEDLYVNGINNLNVRKQMIWGKFDSALTVNDVAKPMKELLNIDRYFEVPGKHFLQEDNGKEISRLIDEMIKHS